MKRAAWVVIGLFMGGCAGGGATSETSAQGETVTATEATTSAGTTRGAGTEATTTAEPTMATEVATTQASGMTGATDGTGDTGVTGDTGMTDGTGTTAVDPPDDPVAMTRKIRDLTGPGTSSKQWGVGGTDLGIPVRQPDGKIAYIFGDTFENDGVGGPGWRSPVLLRSEPGGLEAGIEFTGAAGGGYAKQILAYDHNEVHSTWLPSDAITIGGRMYLHYMVNKGLGNVLWSEIATSDDNGENWAPSGTSHTAPEPTIPARTSR